MNFLKTYLLPIVIVVAILVVGGIVITSKKSSVAGAAFPAGAPPTVYTSLATTQFQVPYNQNQSLAGTPVSGILFGTCTAINYSSSFPATSTLQMDCAVPNMPASSTPSQVDVSLSVQTTASGQPINGYGGIVVQGASASSTAGFITFDLLNLTGAATSQFKSATSSVNYQIFY